MGLFGNGVSPKSNCWSLSHQSCNFCSSEPKNAGVPIFGGNQQFSQASKPSGVAASRHRRLWQSYQGWDGVGPVCMLQDHWQIFMSWFQAFVTSIELQGLSVQVSSRNQSIRQILLKIDCQEYLQYLAVFFWFGFAHVRKIKVRQRPRTLEIDILRNPSPFISACLLLRFWIWIFISITCYITCYIYMYNIYIVFFWIHFYILHTMALSHVRDDDPKWLHIFWGLKLGTTVAGRTSVAVQVGMGHGDGDFWGENDGFFWTFWMEWGWNGVPIFGQTRCVFFLHFQIGGRFSVLTFESCSFRFSWTLSHSKQAKLCTLGANLLLPTASGRSDLLRVKTARKVPPGSGNGDRKSSQQGPYSRRNHE